LKGRTFVGPRRLGCLTYRWPFSRRLNRRAFFRAGKKEPDSRDEEEREGAVREKNAPADCAVLSLHLV
jgi:hypothetical protein